MRVTSWWMVCGLSAALIACGDDDDAKPSRPAADGGAMQLPDKTAGKGCKRDSDCPNGKCMKELQVGSMTESRPAPGGYCTVACESDGQCGQNGECSVPAQADRGLCLGTCRQQSDCREGYACVGGGNTLGIQVSGSCEPMQKAQQLGSRVAGRECGSDDDCLGGSCASASTVGAEYPGNYCTGRCWRDSECGEGGACLAPTGSSEAGWCYDACEADTDCSRGGYRCSQLSPGFKACFPAPDQLPDGAAGKACTSDTDCGGQKDTCLSELPFSTFSAYENVAAPGGYCTVKCSLDAECGANAQCIARPLQGGLCLKKCTDKADCREGYGCEVHGRDLSDEDKVCVPRPDDP
jgi:hypothetical protein